ncbi:MFS transporter [Streptomyces chrestomyceticus JCM 4735]|uniref:MFS transporter n=1 Tax=Streptomyces chrestomyceticus JCM 4735 TaxID=1306181 RepID=A0A7U9Q296_9ACTN|nr:MFS transporter [Streptomyces chrestomyceticus]GCD39695.1 MFS transporter [Streptomyces chrestomyceticus JCM 4735]
MLRTDIDASPEDRRAAARRAVVVLACVSACTTLVIGFVAAINLAVPLLAAGDLHPTSSELLWIVDGYVVVFACLVIPGGAAGDRFGRKGALLTGLFTVAAGAALSALAPTVAILLAGRVLTGIGAALVLPNCVGILIHATPAERRGRALAVWAGVSGIGGLVGNVGGGAFLTGGSWRTLFLAVVLVALACALWAAAAVPRSSRHERGLDPVGALLFVAAAVALLLGIIEGPELGWTSAFVVTAFTLCAALTAVWLAVELRVRHPMLDPRLFRNPLLATASIGMVVAFFANFGLFYVNASLLQYGRGFSVLGAGLGILPMTLPLLLGTRYVRHLVARAGHAVTLAAAFLATTGGLFGLSTASEQPYAVYACWLVLVGIGITLALPCLTQEITAGLPPQQAGVAGGLQSATRELGSALGVAVVGTALTAGFTRNLPAAVTGADSAPRTVAEALAQAPARHTHIVAAYVDGADAALRVAAVSAFCAGVLVVAGATWAARRTRQHTA